MFKSLVVLVVLLCACCGYAPANADESGLYAIATIHSWHQDRSKGYNEQNYGAGVEWHFDSTWSANIGEYRNSFRHHSAYYGVAFMPFHEGGWSAGLRIQEVSGYTQPLTKFQLIAVPQVSFSYEKVLVNAVFVPPVFNAGILAIQLGWRF